MGQITLLGEHSMSSPTGECCAENIQLAHRVGNASFWRTQEGFSEEGTFEPGSEGQAGINQVQGPQEGRGWREPRATERTWLCPESTQNPLEDTGLGAWMTQRRAPLEDHRGAWRTDSWGREWGGGAVGGKLGWGTVKDVVKPDGSLSTQT